MAGLTQARSSGKQAQRQQQEENECPQYQLLICVLILAEKVSMRLGQVASLWATSVLLGGFVSSLDPVDFWTISGLVLASPLRIFGIHREFKLNYEFESRQQTLSRWLYSVLIARKRKFHIAGSTVLASLLDSSVYLLQLASAIASFAFPVIRLPRLALSGVHANQHQAVMIYYSLVIVENTLFVPANLGWDLLRPLHKSVLFAISHDYETRSLIFDLADSYLVAVLAAARKSVADGLSMSFRRYVADMICERRVDAAAAVLTLDVLYQQGEWIKCKADAEKRAKLAAFVVDHVTNSTTTDHCSREAGISLLTSLVVSRTDTPEPSRFGPLVLFKSLDVPGFVELLATVRSVSRPVIQYLETCIGSSNQDELNLAIRAVTKMPRGLIHGSDLPRLLRDRAAASSSLKLEKPVRLAALILVAFGELELQIPEEVPVGEIVDELVRRPLRVREMAILLGLRRHGLLTVEQRDRVDLSSLLCDKNFVQCLHEILEWYSSLEEEVLVMHLGKMALERKRWIVSFLERYKGRNRPDISKLCGLLVKDRYFFETFDNSNDLRSLL